MGMEGPIPKTARGLEPIEVGFSRTDTYSTLSFTSAPTSKHRGKSGGVPGSDLFRGMIG